MTPEETFIKFCERNVWPLHWGFLDEQEKWTKSLTPEKVREYFLSVARLLEFSILDCGHENATGYISDTGYTFWIPVEVEAVAPSPGKLRYEITDFSEYIANYCNVSKEYGYIAWRRIVQCLAGAAVVFEDLVPGVKIEKPLGHKTLTIKLKALEQ